TGTERTRRDPAVSAPGAGAAGLAASMADTPRVLTLAEVAALVGGRLIGDGSQPVRGVAPLVSATRDQIALFANARYRSELIGSGAGSLLVGADLDAGLDDGRPRVVVADAHAALLPLLALLHPQPTAR